MQTLFDITMVMNDAIEANLPVELNEDNGELRVANTTGRWTTQKTDHDMVVRCVTHAATIEGINSSTVENFKAAILQGGPQAEAFLNDISKAARFIRGAEGGPGRGAYV